MRKNIILLAGLVALLLPLQTTAQFGFSSGPSASARRLFRNANRELTRADRFRDAGDGSSALQSYRQAYSLYAELERSYPEADIDQALLTFRRDYCKALIERLGRPAENFESESASVPRIESPRHLEGAATMAVDPADTDVPPATLESEQAELPLSQAVTISTTELYERLDALRARGDHEQALDLLRQALNQDPSSTYVRLLLAWAFIDNMDYEEALMTLQDLPPTDRGGEPVLLLKAAAQYGQGMPFEALFSLDRALQSNPHSPQAYMNLAWLRYRMDPTANLHEAEAFYRFAVRLGARRNEQLEALLGLGGD